jgi:hypothetical protein
MPPPQLYSSIHHLRDIARTIEGRHERLDHRVEAMNAFQGQPRDVLHPRPVALMIKRASPRAIAAETSWSLIESFSGPLMSIATQRSRRQKRADDVMTNHCRPGRASSVHPWLPPIALPSAG